MTNEIQWLKNKVNKSKSSFLMARLADRYLEVQEVGKALEYAQKAVDKHPNYPTAHFVLAKCFYQNSDYDKSENEVRDTLLLDPTYLGALKLQSELETRVSNFKAVHKTYQKILTFDPLNRDITEKLELVDTTESQEETGSGWSAKDSDFTKEFEEKESSGFDDTEQTSTLANEEDLFSTFEMDESSKNNKTLESEQDEAFETKDFTQEDDFSFEATAQEDTSIMDEAEKLDLDQPGFEEEESHFTELLDDIFSPNLNEEEQREQSDRESLTEQESESMDSFGFEEDLFKDESEEDISPEEKILKDAGNEDFDFPGVLSMMDEDEDEEEPYNPFENADLDESDDEQKESKNTFESDEDSMNDFLASLDINDPSAGTQTHSSNVQEESDQDESESDQILKDDGAAGQEKPELTEDVDSESFVTPTLGEIYAAQGQYAKAIEVFKTLIKKNPKNEWYQSKIDFLQKKLDESEE